MKKRTIEIMDTTLRDGEQTSGVSFSVAEKLTLSRLLLGELNDRLEHAEQLADLVGDFQSHINLIAYNPIEDEKFAC